LSDISEVLHQEAERHADKGRMTKTANFPNPRWRTAAILKILNHHISVDFDKIWCTTAYIELDEVFKSTTAVS